MRGRGRSDDCSRGGKGEGDVAGAEARRRWVGKKEDEATGTATGARSDWIENLAAPTLLHLDHRGRGRERRRLYLPLLFPLFHPPFLTSSPSHLLSLSGEGEMRFRSLASLLLSLATAARSLSFLSLFLRTALFSLSVASLLAARAGRNACFAGTIHSDTWTARACLAPPSSFVCSIPGITCTQLDPEQQEHLLDILKNSTA